MTEAKAAIKYIYKKNGYTAPYDVRSVEGRI